MVALATPVLRMTDGPRSKGLEEKLCWEGFLSDDVVVHAYAITCEVVDELAA